MTVLDTQLLQRATVYIDGQWREPHGVGTLDVENPATGEVFGHVPRADFVDVDAAVAAARRALPVWARLTPAERSDHLGAMLVSLESRSEQIAQVITGELGCPIGFSRAVQAGVPVAVLRSYVEMAGMPVPEERVGNSLIVHEPAGVVAAITPWNYPLYQVMLKVAAALAAGCTVVLKPAALTPLAAYLLLDAADEAGMPAGTLNLIAGEGSLVGEALAAHPGVDVVSFTGSTEVGRRIMRLASDRIARVSLELGGKSANLVFEDADLEGAVTSNLQSLCSNAGQTCSAWTRMIVHRSRLDDVIDLLRAGLPTYKPGDPTLTTTRMGPLASANQVKVVQGFIDAAQSAGATPITLDGYQTPDRGHFVAPWVFTGVDPESALAKDEVFGPVLAVFPFDHADEAVALANDSCFGLSGAVWAGDDDRAIAIARRVETGQLEVNGGAFNIRAPFGGYKQSGLGRELGRWGLEEFLETKSIQLPQRGRDSDASG